MGYEFQFKPGQRVRVGFGVDGAQCLQPHVDPKTGETTVVFSCFNQDQALDRVDFPALNERLRQNQLAEKLTAQWIDRALHLLGARKVAA
jgi:hypothetical protein